MRRWIEIASAFALICHTLGIGASAAFQPWANSSGSNVVLNWSNGGSDDALWGNPTFPSPFLFRFASDSLRSVNSNGVGPLTSSTMGVDLDLQIFGDIFFAEVGVFPTGSYSILGPGSVDATGWLRVEDRDTHAIFTSSMQLSSPSQSVASNDPFGGASGEWSGAMVAHVPVGFFTGSRRITVTVEETLFAHSSAASLGDPGGTAYIDAKLEDLGLTLVILIPEPTGVVLIGCLGPLLLRRRR